MINFRLPPHVRTLGEQLNDLRNEKGIMKQDIAEKMGVDPTRISHMITRGTTAEGIESIAKAAGVPPWYFDVYVLLNAAKTIAKSEELLNSMRHLMSMSDKQFEKVTKKLAA